MELQKSDNALVAYKWKQTCRMAFTHLICLIASWFYLRFRSRGKRIASSSLYYEREKIRMNILNRITNSWEGFKLIRMGPDTFLDLCDLLEKDGGLRPTRRASIEEQVVKTLYILTHNARNRVVQFWFRRSGETTSRHFHNVLRVIIEVGEKLMKQPDGTEVSPKILGNTRYYPYFKDCVGAIDGTHVRVKVSNTEAARYRGRKDSPTLNVLAACTFDLKFSYVLLGWEGTTSDSRILKDALTRADNLKIPEGKYYLVDAGFQLSSGLIPPYRGVRYHLKEYSRNAPQNARELFNHRHASLRNAIERAFGVLKMRFPIIASSTEPMYKVETQKYIVASCCALHNYLMNVDPD